MVTASGPEVGMNIKVAGAYSQASSSLNDVQERARLFPFPFIWPHKPQLQLISILHSSLDFMSRLTHRPLIRSQPSWSKPREHNERCTKVSEELLKVVSFDIKRIANLRRWGLPGDFRGSWPLHTELLSSKTVGVAFC